MTEFNSEPLVNNPYKVISQEKIGNEVFTLKSEDNIVIDESQKVKMMDAIKDGFGIAKKILDKEYFLTYFKDNEYPITLKEKTAGAMNNRFHTKLRFALNSSKESIAAAIIHENVEMWREDEGFIGEGAPLMAEYLFCGEEREKNLYNWLFDNKEHKFDSHANGWGKIVSDFGFEKENVDQTKKSMKEWKNSLDESQKIDFIKQKVLTWKQA